MKAEEHTRETGVTADGMDTDVLPLQTTILTKANTNSINDTDVGNTVGLTDGSTTENFRKTSDTGREASNGLTVRPTRETFVKDNEKVMEDIPSMMADTTQEVGLPEDTKDLENAIGKTVESTQANGAPEWHTVRALKLTPMEVFVMMDNGSMMNLFHLNQQSKP
eukprot:CAMPEP_0194148096 /NCGR_PEP_ID=MMETSP0152-20130528/30069_1 /TAXON_ID=1049557 /ORGANISM="Thalassiothrix antarctica, Strain L6-D1" /LENGTH=164 /DNA_ID=CAMNT_0038849391 /DNA_START=212 /DNA_END=706 /DNA_ORIENTATION=-